MHETSAPPWRKLLVTAICVLLIAAIGSAPSGAQTPDQLDILRNLTVEQQEALLQQASAQPSAEVSPAVAVQAAPSVQNERRRARDVGESELSLMKPGDTVLVQVTPRKDQDANRERLDRLAELVHSRNPYELDRDAQLNLPGFAPVALGGLTEQQATQRLSREPVLLPLEIRVTRLPLAKTGIAALKPFGYDLFDSAPSTFSPVTDAPVPAGYVIGAGDQLVVQLFGGNQNRNLRLTVSRNGTVSFPDLGPIPVSGLTFNAARQTIESRVGQAMIGVRASVTMGETRTIRVFVLGEARLTGSYTVSGFATMTTALFASGGVKEIGSLRDIRLMRQGNVVRRLDLYDFLIHGDTSDDAQLQSGDVIFIPPVGPTVSVDGEVKRPAIYELRGDAGVAEVLRIAGGLTPQADTSRASLTRIDADSRRVVLDVSLKDAAGLGLNVRNGDELRVMPLRPQIESGVALEGFVHRPGAFAWRQDLRLTDVISSIDELKPNADQHYILIRRETAPDRRISVLSADLAAALAARGSTADVQLAPRDRIRVFDLASGRERIIQPLLEDLQLQSDINRPAELVRIGGTVRVPGEYPLEPTMRISDLLRAGGGLQPSAYGGTAELTRYVVDDEGRRRTELLNIDLAAVRRGEPGANLPLQPYDYLLVKETPDWRGQESITIRGEVLFPNTYPIRKGETLREVLIRAGGLTTAAFPEGGTFTRRDLKESEQRELERLARRMRSDIAALSLQAARNGQTNPSETLQAGQSLLSQLQEADATGRFIIDLPGLLAGEAGSDQDVVLRDGDELIVPKRRQEVTVIGEVQNTASYLYLAKYTRSDYIAMSGGTTRKADQRRIYVVRADGRVAKRNGSRLAREYDTAIKPGDTIVVPLDAERMPKLPFWQAVTQILYNVAVSVAAVNSF